jgi:hypothetical protein
VAELAVALSVAQEFPNQPLPTAAPTRQAAEVRRAPRAAYTTPAVFGGERGAPAAGRIEEISAGGAQFVSLTPLAPGATGELRFALPINGRVCRSRATVRWEKLGRGGLRVVGIEMHDTPPDALSVISEYVRLMGGS